MPAPFMGPRGVIPGIPRPMPMPTWPMLRAEDGSSGDVGESCCCCWCCWKSGLPLGLMLALAVRLVALAFPCWPWCLGHWFQGRGRRGEKLEVPGLNVHVGILRQEQGRVVRRVHDVKSL
ncbi:hypothetical protein BCR44DRAFT_1434054, partial [Catenaria anguillulae PL171]